MQHGLEASSRVSHAVQHECQLETDEYVLLQASEAPAPLEEFQPSQLGSLLGNGNSWDAPACTGSAAAGAGFCTERPFAELFAQEMI